MIKEFNNVEGRPQALIYRGTLNAIKELYKMDPDLAGEAAISAIELVLTGQYSSSNPMMGVILAETKEVSKVHADKYEKVVESKKQKKVVEQRLDEIAALVKAKCTQKEVANRLGLTQQTVSNRIALIRKEFPELLQENIPVQVVQDSKTLVQDVQICTSKKTCTEENTCKDALNLFDF